MAVPRLDLAQDRLIDPDNELEGTEGPAGAKLNDFKEVVVQTFIPHHGSVFRSMFVLCAFACVGVNG